ncbi:Periplasmic serine proteases (ClpP class) [hydrothermal vent metagenome]|uniref:Periplasmic serine proteases (ClpP class) n=1 Tax=hydrothermal vent metagenome TaxID=652676 RepID=A0A3B0WAM3_9ZZZZ
MSDSNTSNGASWEREVVTQLAESSLREQRRARRWGIFFKSLTFAYIGAIIYMYGDASMSTSTTNEKHTAIVELNGVIADNEEASADTVITALRDAFDNKNSAGVILRINSPGGSPVQSGYIYDEMVRLREKNPDTPLYAVVTDICASGGYYIASAADKIYADKASIVGSIGVRMDNFGFVDAMNKLGVERRTLTAGKNKALLDPFLPENQKTKAHMQAMLSEIHQQFINSVKEGRGDRLDTSVEGLFSGLIWTGEAAVNIGLIDGLASSSYVAREIIGEETMVNYTVKEDILERFAQRLGSTVAQVISTQFFTPSLR